jgi:hypothetical protein
MRETDLTDDALEQQANELLRATHSLGKQAGIYTDTQIQRQARERERHALDIHEHTMRLHTASCLGGILWRTIRTCLQQHKCPRRALECMRLWMLEFTYRQIAAAPGVDVSHTTVGHDIHTALDILRRDGTLGILETLAEVFGLSTAEVQDILRDGK